MWGPVLFSKGSLVFGELSTLVIDLQLSTGTVEGSRVQARVLITPVREGGISSRL